MTENRKPGWAFWTASALLVAFVLYPLSIGPAAWLLCKSGAKDGDLEPRVFTVIYDPLWILTDGTVGHRPLTEYSDWWADLARD